MGINFAAANMAGYNNPEIEVFTAVLTAEGKISSAPKKSEILDSLRRGCLPFIQVDGSGDGITQVYLLSLTSMLHMDNSTLLSFTATVSFGEPNDLTPTALIYGYDDNQPPTFE